jgi:hypothetical protein
VAAWLQALIIKLKTRNKEYNAWIFFMGLDVF